ncbi:hypothetical protein C922_01833 [Plasmodium inui San Antonio 1]|uniref:U3 small nucleolar RNA-associated protein 4 n=1 Tax=Plasmodium inui San Antonio 1 TaxID=1237626 RepID=W7A8N6_9APIC|nr:hypothetical protein C922_01833 [Plasmodium inui San Antonio 1]EUD67648.1 hypothetical protein C922_01833 [Plasmodium inui San Antonio 1]
MTTIHRTSDGPRGAQRIIKNLYRRTNDKHKQQLSMNLTEFKFYDYESKELRTIETSPCRKYICICDSFGVIYVYRIFKNEFLYLLQLHAHVSKSSIMSIIWISKKNRKKKHLFMANEYKDYVLAITTLCGEIVLYDLENQNRLQSISSNGSISCAKLNNSLQYFGTTNLDGYFYLYNIYSTAGSRIYNCFDRFHEGGAAVSGDAGDLSHVRDVSDDAYNSDSSDGSDGSYLRNRSDDAHSRANPPCDDDAQERPGKRIKMSNDLSQYLEDEDASSQGEDAEDVLSHGEDAESAPALAPKAWHVFSPQTRKRDNKNQTGETFNLFITNRFKCREKLVCLYFVDELKNMEVLLSSVQGGKKSKAVGEEVGSGHVGSEEDDQSDHGEDYHYRTHDRSEGTRPRRNKIKQLEKSYHSYNHYVLLGSEDSKIYKYNITRKLCEGEFKGVNESCIIWDVLYVYKTDEVVCVDNSGSLTIFDNSTFSVKYFFNHHLYKSVSLAKTLNEDYIFTAGVDRYIIKYARTCIQGGGGRASSNVNIRREVAMTGKRSAQMISSKMNGDTVTAHYSGVNRGNREEEEQFFLHKVKETKELNKKWYRINKKASHISDIKRIILVKGNVIVSISDDMCFCLHDTFNQISRYFEIGNAELNRNVYFSANLKTVFCSHAWGIKIHYNDSSICVGGRGSAGGSSGGRSSGTTSSPHAGLIAPKDMEKISAVNYKHIANISYGKNEFVNCCIVNDGATKIACRTNRKLSIYHFNIDDLTIYNYDLSKLSAFKVYSFDFLDDDLVILSFARCHVNENGLKKGEKKEDAVREKPIPGGEDNSQEMYELYEHVQDDEMDTDQNGVENLYTYHVAIYNIEMKQVMEEIEVDRILCNFKKYNNGNLIISTDGKKNVFLFFKNGEKYLKRCLKIVDFNLSRRNIHRSYLFSIVIENLLFIFTLDNFVYIYSLYYGTGSLSFLKSQLVRNYQLSKYRDVSLIDLCLRGGRVERREEEQQHSEETGERNVGDHECSQQVEAANRTLSWTPPHPAPFQSKYCLLLRSCDQMGLVGLNIFNDLAIDVQLTNVEDASKNNTDELEQYYLSSLDFRYNFLNTKQLYFEDANLYNILLREMRRERRRGEALHQLDASDRLDAANRLDAAHPVPTYDALKRHKALTGGQHSEEEPRHEKGPVSTDLLQLSFQSLKNLKRKNILNVRALYTPQSDIVLLLCVPQNIDCTLISVADTKKYAD